MKNRHKGYSLIEVMIVLALIAILAEAVYVTVFRSTTTFSNNTKQGSIQEDARGALDTLVNELRMADQKTLILGGPTLGPNTVTFKIPTGVANGTVTWSTPITYELQPAAAVRGPINAGAQNIVRIQDGATHRMCDFILPAALANPPKVPPGLWIQKSGTNNYIITLVLSIQDETGKHLITTLQSSVTLRNSS